MGSVGYRVTMLGEIKYLMLTSKLLVIASTHSCRRVVKQGLFSYKLRSIHFLFSMGRTLNTCLVCKTFNSPVSLSALFDF